MQHTSDREVIVGPAASSGRRGAFHRQTRGLSTPNSLYVLFQLTFKMGLINMFFFPLAALRVGYVSLRICSLLVPCQQKKSCVA
jgi:hypothetical protein